MTKRECREIRRRLKSSGNKITRVNACYVNTKGEIIASYWDDLESITDDDRQKYMETFRKLYADPPGKFLLPLRMMDDSEELERLRSLLESGLENEEILHDLYDSIISVSPLPDTNYVILSVCDHYAAPGYTKSGRKKKGKKGATPFDYMIFALCPVKAGRLEMDYSDDKQRFLSAMLKQVIVNPSLGFMYPAMERDANTRYVVDDDLTAYIYARAMSTKESLFSAAVFGETDVPKSSKSQKILFDHLISAILDEECSFAVADSLHEQICDRIAVHKEESPNEMLVLNTQDVEDILEKCNVSDKHIQELADAIRHMYPGGELIPERFINTNRITMKTASVKVTMESADRGRASLREIDGRRYLTILVDDKDLTVNGIKIK